MSDENQEVEQITTPPAHVALKSRKEAKPKDPKKVAAGKKLAEYNRRAKEALKNEAKREEMRSVERSTGEGSSDAWIPEISFATVLSVAGVGLTLLDLLMRYSANAATGGTEGSPAEGSPAEGSVHPKTEQPPKFGMD